MTTVKHRGSRIINLAMDFIILYVKDNFTNLTGLWTGHFIILNLEENLILSARTLKVGGK